MWCFYHSKIKCRTVYILLIVIYRNTKLKLLWLLCRGFYTATNDSYFNYFISNLVITLSCWLLSFYLVDVNSDPLRKRPQKIELVNLLIGIRHEWETIGTALNIETSVLGDLRQSNLDSKVKLIRVIENWLETMPTDITTWQRVLDAIEGPIVNNRVVGKKIREYLGISNK